MWYTKINWKNKGVVFLVSFKKMWTDVKEILAQGEIDVDIMEKYSCGFTVRENDTTTFVTRDDFVDFWCKLLYHNEIAADEIVDDSTCKQKYIYKIIKRLPYIYENSGILRIVE